MRVFLTGGTGMVGAHTAAVLAARGHEVVALVRPGRDPAPLEGLATVVRGDLLDPSRSLESAMRGCEAVVHAAALLYRRGAGWAEYERLNVAAVDRVLRVAGAAGARRAVHVSSIAVYAPAAEARCYEESSWLEGDLPARAPYAVTKRAGELAAWRAHEAGAVRLTTVRPGVIYGEHDRWFTPFIAKVARWRAVPLPAGGCRTVPVVYAGNVARGIAAALEREEAVGRAYNLSDDGALTSRALLTDFGATLGRAPRIVPIPVWSLMGLATAGEVVGRMIPAVGSTRRAARRLLHDNAYSSDRARRELGWTTDRLVPPADAVVRTATWWRSRRN